MFTARAEVWDGKVGALDFRGIQMWIGFFLALSNFCKTLTDYSILLKCQCASVEGNVDEIEVSVMQRCLDCANNSF